MLLLCALSLLHSFIGMRGTTAAAVGFLNGFYL